MIISQQQVDAAELRAVERCQRYRHELELLRLELLPNLRTESAISRIREFWRERGIVGDFEPMPMGDGIVCYRMRCVEDVS